MVHALEEQKTFTIKDKSAPPPHPPAPLPAGAASTHRLLFDSPAPLRQVLVGLVADGGAAQQVVVPDGSDGGPAGGPDAAERQRSAQTVAAAHGVHRGEAPDQLDVHLPLRLPPGKFLRSAPVRTKVKPLVGRWLWMWRFIDTR